MAYRNLTSIIRETMAGKKEVQAKSEQVNETTSSDLAHVIRDTLAGKKEVNEESSTLLPIKDLEKNTTEEPKDEPIEGDSISNRDDFIS
jgi:uncharacterized protein YwgA